MTVRNAVEQALNQGLEIDFDSTFSKAWSTFKENMGTYLLYSLLCFICCCFIFGIFMGPLFVLGFSTFSKAAEKSNQASLNDCYKPFQKFGSLFVLGIIYMIINIALTYPYLSKVFPLYVEMVNNITDKEALNEIAERASAISPLTSYYGSIAQFIVAVFTFYAPYLIYYGDYGIIESLGVSVQLVTKKFALLLFMFFIAAIVKYSGLFMCCIGLIFTVPYAYVFYHEVFNTTILSKTEAADSSIF